LNNSKSYLNKIYTIGMEEELKEQINIRKHFFHERIVFTNGCFDILHSGHLELLYNAKSYGEKLIVGLNSDSSVKFNKGRQIINEKDRSEILASIEYVDYVIIFNETTPYYIISYLKPHILVKGSDWFGRIIGSDLVEEVVEVPRRLNISTTSIIQKIKEKT